MDFSGINKFDMKTQTLVNEITKQNHSKGSLQIITYRTQLVCGKPPEDKLKNTLHRCH